MSVKVLSAIALLSTLCFIALVTIQVMEYQHYEAPPSVWLPKP
jgi:hypothetical protein